MLIKRLIVFEMSRSLYISSKCFDYLSTSNHFFRQNAKWTDNHEAEKLPESVFEANGFGGTFRSGDESAEKVEKNRETGQEESPQNGKKNKTHDQT